MIVRLNNEYYVESVDDWNVVLRKSYVSYGSGAHQSEKPKMVEKDLGYFRTVEEALTRFWRITEREKTEDFDGDIEGYINRLENIRKDTVDTLINITKGGKGK